MPRVKKIPKMNVPETIEPPVRNYPKGTISTQYNFVMQNDLDDWIQSEQKRLGFDNKAQTVKFILRNVMNGTGAL